MLETFFMLYLAIVPYSLCSVFQITFKFLPIAIKWGGNFFADVIETPIININYGEFEVFGFFCRIRPNPVPALMKKPRVLGVW